MEFTLRPFCMDDVKNIQFHANNPNIARNMRNGFPCPFTLDDAAALVGMLTKAHDDRILARAVCVNGVAVGSIGIFVQDDVYCKTADIAYWLSEQYWGLGIMSAAISQICSQAFTLLDIVRIQAEPFAQNHASHRVLEKAGFNKEGILRSRVFKDGSLQDAYVYALLKNDQSPA